MNKNSNKKSKKPVGLDNRLYTLEIFIIEGLLTEEFVEKNPEISRKIQIRGDQTLQDLHKIIFKAFDRIEEHMYEFQFGDGPGLPENSCYVLPSSAKDNDNEGKNIAGMVTETTIGSLGLKVDQPFGYWFDFGDNWWHQINVDSIDDEIPEGKYPKIIGRIGESPPQYPDFDEEDEDEDEE
jgi:hypothetical protein